MTMTHPSAQSLTASKDVPLDIGSQLQLFVDRYIVGSLDRLELRLHEPARLPKPRQTLMGHYITVIKDGDLYRAYCRDDALTYYGQDARGEKDRIEFCRYAESRDGHEWEQPKLGLYEVKGTQDNNVIMSGGWGKAHNFCPFLDTAPGVEPARRYKALATGQDVSGPTVTVGLRGFISPDGIHWEETQDIVRERRGGAPRTGLVIERGPDVPAWNAWFDSQNVSFWSEAEQQYVCYFRTRIRQAGREKPLRAISRTTAKDFFGDWSPPVLMEANLPGENLYTSQTHPYFRAPHIYLALPTRLMDGGRQGAPFPGSLTEIVFMSSRPGSVKYDRLFTEAFIRPGLDPVRWGSLGDQRANYVSLNVVPTGPDEMSFYHRSGHRYVLRTDGFVSVHAGARGGEFVTKPLVWSETPLIGSRPGRRAPTWRPWPAGPCACDLR